MVTIAKMESLLKKKFLIANQDIKLRAMTVYLVKRVNISKFEIKIVSHVNGHIIKMKKVKLNVNNALKDIKQMKMELDAKCVRREHFIQRKVTYLPDHGA
jgi:hypothetical protein